MDAENAAHRDERAALDPVRQGTALVFPEVLPGRLSMRQEYESRTGCRLQRDGRSFAAAAVEAAPHDAFSHIHSETYKTQMCPNIIRSSIKRGRPHCPYGDRCNFAHSAEELQPRHRNKRCLMPTVTCLVGVVVWVGVEWVDGQHGEESHFCVCVQI